VRAPRSTRRWPPGPVVHHHPPVATLAPTSTSEPRHGQACRADHSAMDPGSCSRRSWADEVEEEEAARSAARSVLSELPPLAAATHASLVLRASTLDPEAKPFLASPGAERIHFTDSKASFGDSEPPPLLLRGKDVVASRAQRRHHRHRPCRGGLQLEEPVSPVRPPPPATASGLCHRAPAAHIHRARR
jgi:hypothetical protein